jgi:glutamate dehydrogenase/leucine dehydrogenase
MALTMEGTRVLGAMAEHDHEEVVHVYDRPSGLRAIIAIHSTRLGPALGGTRFRPYPSELDALQDALRLSQGMTCKAALAGLDLGGGKGVILGDPRTDKTPELLAAYGRAVESLNGRFNTGEDMGMGEGDIDVVACFTGHVCGGSPARGGSGDPSPWTARGVELSIREVLARLDGSSDLHDRTVAVSGLGKVGAALVRDLLAGGARVVVADVDSAAVARVVADAPAGSPVEVVGVVDIHRVACDVYAPCAIGGVLNEVTVSELACRAVVGSANNQLAEPADGYRLADRGILYGPDYVVNAGGLISVADELYGWERERVRTRVEAIPFTLRAVLDEAAANGLPPSSAADRLAAARVEAGPRA